MKERYMGVIAGNIKNLGVDDNHKSGLLRKYFDMIVRGSKVYEVRLNDEKRRKIKVGDIYAFGLEPDRYRWIKRRVTERLNFSSFEEMSEVVNFKLVGFNSKETMIKTYKEIYPEEKVEKYGIVVFKLTEVK